MSKFAHFARMRRAWMPTLWLLTLFLASMTSAFALTVKDLQPRTFTAADGKTLPYRLYTPADYDAAKKYPLVLFLHGAGERGDDNERQLNNAACLKLIDPTTPVFFIAPQCAANEQWVDVPFNQGSYSTKEVPISDNLQMALDTVAALQKEFSIDATRLYITGLSMGGYGTWDAVARRPGQFAAAIAVCGGADPTQATGFQGTGIWAFHSAGDPSVPSKGSRDMIRALWAAGQNPNYTEYTDGSHNSWSRAYSTPELAKWLYSHHK